MHMSAVFRAGPYPQTMGIKKPAGPKRGGLTYFG